jgi:hypothetical protein
MDSSTANHLPLEPLGAGDLVDRAIRLYRRHFSTLIRIAAPPVVIYSFGWVLVGISWRDLWVTSESSSLGLYMLILLAGFMLGVGGSLFMMIVMGGAARNLVSHLLWNEPVSVKTTYVNVKSRFWSLLGATILVGIILVIVFFVIFYAYAIVLAVAFAGLALLAIVSTPLFIVGMIIVGTIITLAALWLFFWIAGRFAYVPQIILIEGKGTFDAIGRSNTLAKGNASRLLTMFIFSLFTSYSVMMILVAILLWFGYWNGIELSHQELWPRWYTIAYQVLGQSASIVIAPVFMLGLSLLYVDARVRHEGYDIELLAAKRLGDVPKQAPGVHLSPLAPALTKEGDDILPQQTYQGVRPPQRTPPPNSTLGLG